MVCFLHLRTLGLARSLETLGFRTLTLFAAFLHGRTPLLPTSLRQMVQILFLGFLMWCVFLAPFAIFLELDLSLSCFFIFSRMIIDTFTFFTRELYEIFL